MTVPRSHSGAVRWHHLPEADDSPLTERAARPRKRVTHRDVARLAAVSTAVVSYVINNGPRAASPEARARVLKAIEELDYHPNAVARGLRAQRTHTIGFIARDYSPLDVFVSPFSAAVLTGLAVELKDNGYYLLVHPLLIGEDLGPLGRLLRSGRLDGVVVRQVKAYPVYDADYKANVGVVREYLEANLPNLHLVGRNGMHHYNNQDHSMMTALLTARNIAAGSRIYDPWKVNNDAEYHEEARPQDEDRTGRLMPRKVA